MRLEDYISLHAQQQGQRLALSDGATSLSYAQLDALIHERAALYAERKGEAVAFRVTQTADCVVTYLALHVAGCVAVPLAADFPADQLEALQARLAADRFDAAIADILFTTGTTGQSKGVMITHEAILADAENLVGGQLFTPELTFIICGPLNHIGSLSKLYPTFRVGASAHILEGIKDVGAFFQAVERVPAPKVATFLVPASIRMLLALDGKRLAQQAHRIDFIETGAAPIAEADMQRLHATLPQTRLYNTYASTETGIIATHNFAPEADCLAGCLGRPMQHSRLVISEEGRVVCSGRTLMAGYWQEPELTASVLHDGAVHTHDVGYLDAAGRLRLTGRDDDIINVGGYKVAPTEVEDVAAALPGVSDCICIATEHRVLGTVLKLLLVTEQPGRPTLREVAAALKAKLEGYKVPQSYEYVDKIERTFNGKLNRKAYR